MSTITSFAPIANADAKILILGSMPGVASLTADEYYHHPRNSFWWIISQLLSFDYLSSSYAERCQQLRHHKIALWDVIHQCQRSGSLDSAIDKLTLATNNFTDFFDTHKQLQHIFCNGGTAYQLFIQRVAKPLAIDLPITQLPSTSPAYAALTKEKKLIIWQSALKDYL